MLAKWSWIIGGFFLAKFIGEFIYTALRSPGDGINVFNAAVPAFCSALIWGGCVWKSGIFSANKKI